MKLMVHVPLSYDREYLDDFDENTLPNIGDVFEDIYVVREKQIDDNLCELTLARNEEWYKGYEELYVIGE